MKPSAQAYSRAPLEYRIALDAACAWVYPARPVRLHCQGQTLRGEALQRLNFKDQPPWGSALWLEPQAESWQGTLGACSQGLPGAGRLAVVLSLPLARRLPERQGWQDAPLGWQKGGWRSLQGGLAATGFTLKTCYGLHTGQSVMLNLLARLAHLLGQPALADQLGFAARERYSRPLGQARLATCALLLAVKG